MSQQGVANKTVEWAIAAVRSFATLPADLQVVAFGSGEDAQSERVIVKCEVGAKLDSGVEPYQCTLSFKLKTQRRSAEDADDIFAKVEAAINASLNNAASIARATSEGFIWLQTFVEEADSATDNSADIREYTRTIPLRVLLSS